MLKPVLCLKLLLLGTFFFTTNSFAAQAFLDAWRAYYPDSQSSDIDCQLCHQRVTGGDGWNSYGWSVRDWYIQFGRSSIEQAFELAETANSDQDDLGLSNLEEIQRSLYPGWVNTKTNIIIFKDYSFITNQPAPFQEGEAETEKPDLLQDDFCFPIKAENKGLVLVCL